MVGIDKLRLGWSIRAKKFEERIRKNEGNIIKQCWKEKEDGSWKDIYRVKRRRCYLRNGC